MTHEEALRIAKAEVAVDMWVVEQLHEKWKRGCGHNSPTQVVYDMEICQECNCSCPL